MGTDDSRMAFMRDGKPQGGEPHTLYSSPYGTTLSICLVGLRQSFASAGVAMHVRPDGPARFIIQHGGRVGNMLTALRRKVKANLPPESLAYKGLAFIFNYSAFIFSYPARRTAYMRLLKDGRFVEDELWMASFRPQHLLDAVLDRYHPSSFLDVGCGVGYGLQYVAAKGVESLGLEGSKAALAVSPVPDLIRLTSLNRAVDLGRKFDLVWSFEVAEHIHPVYTDVFLETLPGTVTSLRCPLRNPDRAVAAISMSNH
jgi:hypothetical protein